MFEKTILVNTKDGLHPQLSSLLTSTASKYTADIQLLYKNRTVDVKSIMGLMSLAVPNGTEVVVRATGEDGEAAIAAIEKVLQGE